MTDNKKLYIVDWKPNSPTKEKVIYSIELSSLREPVRDDDPILSPLLPLVDRNVAFAAVPENFGEGVACYLLNLNSLKP
ncbi:MAG: hypothetical protein RL701_5630 [Pseudomonadota bacterium]|jgi:hypothetical protein